jgi:hypothetical protein
VDVRAERADEVCVTCIVPIAEAFRGVSEEKKQLEAERDECAWFG